MIRNTILYHRLWYVRKRNSGRIRVYTSLISIMIVVVIIASFAQKRVIPYIEEISEFKTNEIINMVINDTVSKDFYDTLKHQELVMMIKDDTNHVTAIQANTANMDMLASKISDRVQENLISVLNKGITIRSDEIYDNPVFSAIFPDVHIRVKLNGKVKSDFKSELLKTNVNKTVHRLYLQTKMSTAILLPMEDRNTESTVSTLFSEAVLVDE